MLLKENHTKCSKGKLMICVNSSCNSGSKGLCWSVDERDSEIKEVKVELKLWKRIQNITKKLKDFLS